MPNGKFWTLKNPHEGIPFHSLSLPFFPSHSLFGRKKTRWLVGLVFGWWGYRLNMTASRLAISSARMIMSHPVRHSTGTGCHHIGPPRIRSMPSIFLPGSLEDRGLDRLGYLRCRRIGS